ECYGRNRRRGEAAAGPGTPMHLPRRSTGASDPGTPSPSRWREALRGAGHGQDRRVPASISSARRALHTGRAPVRCSWLEASGEAQMDEDIRAEAAKYYDVSPTILDDIAFYQARLPSSDATV